MADVNDMTRDALVGGVDDAAMAVILGLLPLSLEEPLTERSSRGAIE